MPTLSPSFGRDSDVQPRQQIQSPRFGNALAEGAYGLIAHTRPVFESIESSFISELLVADMGMWLTRIGTALARGRQPYDVDQDPTAQSLSPLHRTWRQVSRNVFGLDYPNAWEETMRELQAGPSLLVVPSLSFALWKKYFGGGDAFSLPTGAFLTPMNQKFGEFLAQTLKKSPDGVLSTATQRQALAEFIQHHLIDVSDYPAKALQTAHPFHQLTLKPISVNAIAPNTPPHHGKPPFLYESLKQWRNEKQSLETLTGQVMQEIVSIGRTRTFKVSAATHAQTLPDYMQQWSTRWAEAALKSVPEKSTSTTATETGRHVAQQARHEMELLNAELKRNLVAFHRRVKPVDDQFLERLDQLKPAIGKGDHVGIDTMMQRLGKWKGFAVGVLRDRGVSSSNVVERIAHMQKALLKKKLNWMLVAGALNGIWLASISVMAQSGHSYPANRQANSASGKLPPRPALPARALRNLPPQILPPSAMSPMMGLSSSPFMASPFMAASFPGGPV